MSNIFHNFLRDFCQSVKNGAPNIFFKKKKNLQNRTVKNMMIQWNLKVTAMQVGG